MVHTWSTVGLKSAQGSVRAARPRERQGLQHPVGSPPNVAAVRWDTAWGLSQELSHLFPQVSIASGTVGQVGHFHAGVVSHRE
jgi:hypothetical protein